MAKTLTAANAVIMLTVDPIIRVPQQLQGFAADDVFNTDAIETAEVSMGVDGVLSGGFVYVAVKQNFVLQSDSDSCAFFDNWYLAQQSAVEAYIASGTEVLPSLRIKYAMMRGFLTGYTPVPPVKKIVQPRNFAITWQRATPSAAS